MKKTGLLVIFIIVATELIGFGLIMPVLPQIAERLGLSFMQIGILLSSYSVAQFIATPLLGSLSDRYGRKPILLISKLGTVMAYVMFAYSTQYYWLLASRLLDGFTGGNISVARAYIVDVTTEKTRSKGMALLGIAFGLGFIIGPGMGGILYKDGSHQIGALVAGAMSLISFILTIFLLQEPDRYQRDANRKVKLTSLLSVIKQPVISFILVMHFMRMIVFAGFETTFSIYLSQGFGFEPKDSSMMFFYLGVLGLIIQGTASRFHMKSSVWPIGLGLIFTSIAYFGMSQVSNLYLLTGVLIIFELGLSLTMIYIPTLLTAKNNEAAHVGGLMGVYESVGSLARIIGPLVAYSLLCASVKFSYMLFAFSLLPLCLLFLVPQFRNWLSPKSHA